jgi:hypothetical protein
LSRARSHPRPREPSEMGLKDEKSVKMAKKLDLQGRKNWLGGAGEGDNTKQVHLVKWCNTGKKRNGTHYQRWIWRSTVHVNYQVDLLWKDAKRNALSTIDLAQYVSAHVYNHIVHAGIVMA